MLNEGLAMMAVGLGTVFSFLIILWVVVSCLGVVITYLNKLFPEKIVSTPAAKTTCDDSIIAAVIAAAKLRK